LAEDFPIPRTVAAWDTIVFTVPEGIEGCQASIAVQAGDVISNIGAISVSRDGGNCPELSAITSGDVTTLSGKIKIGNILLSRTAVKTLLQGVSSETVSDVGAVTFVEADLGPNRVPIPAQYLGNLGRAAGSCVVTSTRSDLRTSSTSGDPGTRTVLLDAGPVIRISGPAGAREMQRQESGAYAAAFATLINTSIPGLPPISTGERGFLDPGTYTLDNGSGGSDIPGFQISLDQAKPVTWDDIDAVTAIPRAQGLTVRWSGGDPEGVVWIVGTASRREGEVAFTGTFTCYERAAAGQFTVPPFVTLHLPAVDDALSSGSQGLLLLQAVGAKHVVIPGVDLTYFLSTSSIGKSVAFP
jgi:hypothetical protein